MTVPAAATRLTPGFCHGRRTRLGGGLDGICHLGRAASLPKAAGERQKQALKAHHCPRMFFENPHHP